MKPSRHDHRRSETARASTQMRRSGQVPAVLYGPKRTLASSASRRRVSRRRLVHLDGSHLIRLVNADGADAEPARAHGAGREMQRHPVTGQVLHADFYEVDLTERLVVSSRCISSASRSASSAGGIRRPILREIEVEWPAHGDPGVVEIDLSDRIHDAIHLATEAAEGVQAVGDPTQTLVTVLSPPDGLVVSRARRVGGRRGCGRRGGGARGCNGQEGPGEGRRQLTPTKTREAVHGGSPL